MVAVANQLTMPFEVISEARILPPFPPSAEQEFPLRSHGKE